MITPDRLEPGKIRLAVVSDSAFQAREYDGLAMRGCCILLMQIDSDAPLAGQTYKVVLLDWYSKKQQHVVRSTYAAELHTLVDAIQQGRLLRSALTEIEEGAMTAAQMLELVAKKSFALGMYAFIDAKSVFGALRSEDAGKLPSEECIVLQVLAIREALQHARLSCR